jgi:hypothetical protein
VETPLQAREPNAARIFGASAGCSFAGAWRGTSRCRGTPFAGSTPRQSQGADFGCPNAGTETLWNISVAAKTKKPCGIWLIACREWPCGPPKMIKTCAMRLKSQTIPPPKCPAANMGVLTKVLVILNQSLTSVTTKLVPFGEVPPPAPGCPRNTGGLRGVGGGARASDVKQLAEASALEHAARAVA